MKLLVFTLHFWLKGLRGINNDNNDNKYNHTNICIQIYILKVSEPKTPKCFMLPKIYKKDYPVRPVAT